MTESIRHRPFVALTCMTLLLAAASSARAGCTLSKGGAQVFTFTFPDPNIHIPRDAPIGTVLATSTASGDHSVTVACTPGSYSVTNMSISGNTGDETDGIFPIYRAGFGFRIKGPADNNYLRAGTTTYTAQMPHAPSAVGRMIMNNSRPRYGLVMRSHQYSLELVKTAHTLAQRHFPAQDLFQVNVDHQEVLRFRLANTVRFLPKTCTSFISNTQSVSLGTVGTNRFTGINTSPSTPSPARFELRFDCSDYVGSVRATFTDATNNGNLSDTLSLSADSSATGVGVQILFRDFPIRLGPASALPGNLNQFELFFVTATDVDRPLRSVDFHARYLQTTDAVSPGTVRARATVTFSYQ